MALLQETWKDGVPPEIAGPFERAASAFRAGDLSGATSALDLLSIRLAEPRWPTLREPFRRLRVPIPVPAPPQWDPDHALPGPEKEARQARRAAEEQLVLAEASLLWASAQEIPTEGLPGALASAKASLASPGVAPEFYVAVDSFWQELGERLPPPRHAARPALPSPGPDR